MELPGGGVTPPGEPMSKGRWAAILAAVQMGAYGTQAIVMQELLAEVQRARWLRPEDDLPFVLHDDPKRSLQALVAQYVWALDSGFIQVASSLLDDLRAAVPIDLPEER